MWQSLSLSKPQSVTTAADSAALQSAIGDVQTVLVHPFFWATGEGEQRPTHLSFANAQAAMADKLANLNATAATLVAVAATSHEALADRTQTLIDQTQILWLLTPAQRAKLLAELEQHKFIQPVEVSRPAPVRQTHTLLHIGKVAELYQARGRQIAKQQAATAVGSIAEELADFDAVKTNHSAEVDSAIDAVTLNSAQGYALHLPSDPAGQLRQTSGPGAEMSLTVMLAFVGDIGALTAINELFGL